MVENLYTLHKFNVVHMDIKPENIMFSKHFNKAVFIDFGLSEITNAPIGSEKLVSFKGTPDYCCPEMATAFSSDEKQFVDLYYNDVYCLLKSIRKFKQI